MFPTEELIEKIKRLEERSKKIENMELHDGLMEMLSIFQDMLKANREYYEWKKKPFMGEK